MEFKLPDIGEGVAEGEILKWMVNEGDKIAEDQPLVEVMTDKVNVQIPSPTAGVVSRILAKEGASVKVGETIVIIESDEGAGATAASAPTKQPAPAQAYTPQKKAESPPQSMAPQPSGASLGSVLATPATRRLARELRVELTGIRGSGPAGRITDEDVRKAADVSSPQQLQQQQLQQQKVNQGTKQVQAPAATKRPDEDRVPIRGVRKLVAEKMAKSIHTTAQVTHVDEADLTELVLLREAFKGSAEKRGVKLTFLPLLIKAIIPALKGYPYVNATLDEQAGEIVLKKGYNIGIATDTENGLVVPVIKDADKKDVFQIAMEIQELSSRAREGQLSLEEVHGSTFTITNQGSVGGLFATPIINYPEAAILGTHRISKRPVVRDGKIEIRDIMFISLSFDHRVFDGAYAARFVNRVIEIIQDPKLLLAEIL